jgi:hypothetical protein
MSFKNISIWLGLIIGNCILVFITIFLQVIGYGTSPKIIARNEVELKSLVAEQVFDYNKTYLIQILVIGIILFIMNFIFLKWKNGKTLKLSLIITAVYFVVALITLLIISSNFAALNLKYFHN